MEHLSNFNFDRNQFPLPKDRKSNIDILFDSTQNKPKAITITDFEKEFLDIQKPTAPPSLRGNDFRKLITAAALDDSGTVNVSLNESKPNAEQLNFSEVKPEESALRINSDNHNNDDIYHEMLDWLNENGAPVDKQKVKMEIVNVEKNSSYVVLLTSEEDDTVQQAFTVKKHEPQARLSDIYLGGVEDSTIQFQGEIDLDDVVNNEPIFNPVQPIEITEVKPEFYFFVKKRVKEMVASVAEIQEIPDFSSNVISFHKQKLPTPMV